MICRYPRSPEITHPPAASARDRIRLAEVVVTADQPLGVWHVDGQVMAPLWRAAQAAPGREAEAMAQVPGCSSEQAHRLLHWMRSQGWL